MNTNNIDQIMAELDDFPQLPFTEETLFVVDYNDWDKFVNKVYGTKDYEIVAEQELYNGSKVRFDVPYKWKLHQWDLDEIALLKQGKYKGVSIHIIAHDLYSRGLLPTGNYLIEVSW